MRMNLALNWLCFLRLGRPVFYHIFLSYKSLRHFSLPANWLCFFKFLFAIRITQYSKRNKLALFFQPPEQAWGLTEIGIDWL